MLGVAVDSAESTTSGDNLLALPCFAEASESTTAGVLLVAVG